MDVVRSIRRPARAVLTGLSLLLLAVGGCVTPSTSFFHAETLEPAPCRVACWWDRNVRITQDSVNNGAPVPGLAGRMYLFAEDQEHLVAARGTVIAEWYDGAAPAGSNPQRFRVTYYAKDLERMKRKDRAGVGYTLFLPWPDYRRSIDRVKIHLCFIPEKGSYPLYADVTEVSLQGDTPVISRQHVVPVVPVPPGLELKK